MAWAIRKEGDRVGVRQDAEQVGDQNLHSQSTPIRLWRWNRVFRNVGI